MFAMRTGAALLCYLGSMSGSREGSNAVVFPQIPCPDTDLALETVPGISPWPNQHSDTMLR